MNGRFEGITLDDLYAVAERHRVPAYRRVTADVLAAVDSWPAHAGAAEVPDDVALAIAVDLDRFRPR